MTCNYLFLKSVSEFVINIYQGWGLLQRHDYDYSYTMITKDDYDYNYSHRKLITIIITP